MYALPLTQQRIDSMFLGIEKKSNDFFFKPLNDEVALEKVPLQLSQGVEFFYEVLIYTIIITLPLYEIYSSAVDSRLKSQKEQERLHVRVSRLLAPRPAIETPAHTAVVLSPRVLDAAAAVQPVPVRDQHVPARHP